MVTARALRLLVAALGALFVIGLSTPAAAQEERASLVDRVIGRWRVVEGGKPGKARPIFARELAFEARLEALASGEGPTGPLTEPQLRAALARHVTESLLAELPLDPPPSPAQVGEQASRARRFLLTRIGGEERLRAALEIERISTDELDALLRRTARASLYLDRMVAPQVDPTEIELRQMHATGQTPFSEQRFQDVAGELRRWVVAQRLAEALEEFYQRARSRVVITWAVKPAG